MLKNKLFAFLIIISIALITRFFQLGVNPPSLDWDEVSLGYNAYSILKTGADEYGNKFPLSIRSFDDYKPPVYVFLAIPSIWIFGLNEFSVRFPAAVIGVLTVITIYFLVKELLMGWEEKTVEFISLISALFLAISPWHLQFSRAAFEGNVGLFFLLLGLFFLLKGLKSPQFFIYASFPFVASLYSYHSFRLLVPLFILTFLILFWKKIHHARNYLIVSGLILFVCAIPILTSFFESSGSSSRLSMVSIFSGSNELDFSIKRMEYDNNQGDYIGSFFHNRRFVFFKEIVKGYVDHWNPNFLFLYGDGGRQHHAVDVGMLYLWDALFILYGIQVLLKRPSKRVIFLLVVLMFSPIPAAFTTGTPHPVRAIAMMPFLHILAAIGLVFALRQIFLFKNKLLIILGVSVIGGTFMLNIIYYFHQYYVHTPIEYGDFWQYGNKEAILEAKKIEGQFDKIIMTYKYDQPYIYYLFYNQIDPSWYQKNWDYKGNGQVDRSFRKVGKYEFRSINYSKDNNTPRTLLIGSPDEIPYDARNIIKEIKFPNGEIAYRIVGT